MKSIGVGSYKFQVNKHLGQNFLVNEKVHQRIIEACDLKENDVVLEIGPGKGALTRTIAARVGRLIAIETDDRLAGALADEFQGSHVEIIRDDILKYPFEDLPDRVKVIGNLPYNISTPIIEKVLQHHNKFTDFYLTVQLEFAQRLCGAIGTKDYGSLTCFVQYHALAKMLFKIKNTAFRPIPKVQSCFMHLQIPERPRFDVANEKRFFQIIRSCFLHRRKTIANALSGIMKKEEAMCLLDTLKIDPKLRPENLTLENYIRMYESQ